MTKAIKTVVRSYREDGSESPTAGGVAVRPPGKKMMLLLLDKKSIGFYYQLAINRWPSLYRLPVDRHARANLKSVAKHDLQASKQTTSVLSSDRPVCPNSTVLITTREMACTLLLCDGGQNARSS
jgi:hypothetical protein